MNRSLIDLLHPEARADRVLVVGHGLPSYLRDFPQAGNETLLAAAGTIDLVVVVPSTAECRITGWLRDTAFRTARLLHPNGMLCAMVPRQWRARFLRHLREAGCVLETAYVYAVDGAHRQYLIGCDVRMSHFALTTMSMRRASAMALRRGWMVPGAAGLVRRMWPNIICLLRRPGARPAMTWLNTLTGVSHNAPGVIRCKSAGSRVTATVCTFDESGSTPTAVVKVPLSDSATVDRQREATILGQLAPGASSAGVRVPVASSVTIAGGRFFLRLTPLAGVPAASILAGDPHRLVEIASRIAGWLEQWHLGTQREAQSDRSALERLLLEPATELAPLFPDGERYLAWLRQRCDQISHLSLPLVAAHHDLTMVNILVSDDDTLGIIDWESAGDEALPLTDFFYAAADACAAAKRYRHRSRSFIEAFDVRTPYGQHVRALSGRLARSLGLADDVITLLQHACVLHHARNERDKSSETPGPFTTLARWLISSTRREELVA